MPDAELIAVLRRPEFYPHRPERVVALQTHISYVFLAGAEVFKIKKPVRFSFLDFSTLERRRHLCGEEVRLNRRLAPDAYLGVVSLCPAPGGYRFGGDDDPAAIEYAVHMRRLPEERMLDRLLDAGEVSEPMVESLAEKLAAFHAVADCGPEVTANGDVAAIEAILRDNYANAAPFRGRTIAAADDEAIGVFALNFLRDHANVFRARQAAHRIRDCHGDLHAEHICFTDGLVIYDCIEFNPRFRFCDVASDLAFLAMDLDFHGRPDLSACLLRSYERASGDSGAKQLAAFYQCYRAYVRGKVDSLKSAESEVGEAEREAAAESARRHFALAYRYTWSYRPGLVVVAGLSGTGKSRLAAELSQRTGFAHVNSDVVRKRLAGLEPTARVAPEYESGLYSPEHSERTYAAILAEAARHLDAGRGVVLDATFQLRRGRDAARRIAAERGAAFLLAECRCDTEILRRRLAERAARGDDPSDADWAVYVEQRQRFEAVAAEEADGHLVLDTGRRGIRFAAAVEAALRRRATVDRIP